MMWIKLSEKIKSLIKSSACFIWKKRAWIFLLVAIVGFGIILPIEYASAGFGETIVNALLDFVIAPIIWIVSFIGIIIAWFFTWIAVGILESAMQPNLYTATLGSGSNFINAGWGAVRDLANMFFILILLFIAFGTILRIEAYKAKNLLPKLIIAIFLVNFSKIIALVVVDFSQIFMYSMYNQIGSFEGSQGHLIGLVGNFAKDYAWNAGALGIANAVGAFGACIFSFTLALTYLALAAFMIIRLTMLCLLVVLAPAVFLLWVLPSTAQYFSKWCQNLINYAMIGPVFVFFIWLAGLMAQQLFNPTTSLPFSVNIPDVAGEPLSGLSGAFENIIPFAVVIFLLLFSLSATKQLGIWGANMVYGATIGKGLAIGGTIGFAAGRWSKGGMTKLGRRTGKVAKHGLGSFIKEDTRKKWGDRFKRVPVARGLVMDYEAKRHKEKRGEIEKYSQIGSKDSFELNKDIIKSRFTDPEEVAGRLESLAKTGEYSKFKDTLSEKEQNRILTKAKYAGVDMDYLANRDPRTDDDQKRKKEVHRMHEEGKLGQIEAGALKDKDLVETLRNELDPEEFRNWYKRLGKDQQKAMMKGLKDGFGTFDSNDIDRRRLFAKYEGKIKEAFTDAAGVFNGGEAEKFVKSKDLKIENVKKDEDLRIVGDYITKARLATREFRELPDEPKKIIKHQIKTTRAGTPEENYVDTSEGWAV